MFPCKWNNSIIIISILYMTNIPGILVYVKIYSSNIKQIEIN